MESHIRDILFSLYFFGMMSVDVIGKLQSLEIFSTMNIVVELKNTNKHDYLRIKHFNLDNNNLPKLKRLAVGNRALSHSWMSCVSWEQKSSNSKNHS